MRSASIVLIAALFLPMVGGAQNVIVQGNDDGQKSEGKIAPKVEEPRTKNHVVVVFDRFKDEVVVKSEPGVQFQVDKEVYEKTKMHFRGTDLAARGKFVAITRRSIGVQPNEVWIAKDGEGISVRTGKDITVRFAHAEAETLALKGVPNSIEVRQEFDDGSGVVPPK